MLGDWEVEARLIVGVDFIGFNQTAVEALGIAEEYGMAGLSCVVISANKLWPTYLTIFSFSTKVRKGQASPNHTGLHIKSTGRIITELHVDGWVINRGVNAWHPIWCGVIANRKRMILALQDR